MTEKSPYTWTTRVQKSFRVNLITWLREEFDIKEGDIIELAFLRKVKAKKSDKKIIG